MGRPAKSKTAETSTVETVTDEVVKATETVSNDTETVKSAKDQPVKVEQKSVSQSTKPVSFKWIGGKKDGKVETMSENVAEILERKSLGQKVN